MAFIEIDISDKKGSPREPVTINTGFIYKVLPDTKSKDRSIISWDLDQATWDSINESYDSLIKRIKEAEEVLETTEEK